MIWEDITECQVYPADADREDLCFNRIKPSFSGEYEACREWIISKLGENECETMHARECECGESRQPFLPA